MCSSACADSDYASCRSSGSEGGSPTDETLGPCELEFARLASREAVPVLALRGVVRGDGPRTKPPLLAELMLPEEQPKRF